MTKTLTKLITCLSGKRLANAEVIRWGAPVPSFGDATVSTIATLGLNPSNREFVDESGQELKGAQRRFHTLQSLGIARWSDASHRHVRLIHESCRTYFSRNPYDGWFKRLDYIIGGIASYYGSSQISACHLDLIPYATACKWTALNRLQRDALIKIAQETLGLLIQESAVRVLVLNGSSVISNFEQIAGIRLSKFAMSSFSLPRRDGQGIPGFAYTGTVREIAGIRLRNRIKILGYNHNIQSSFGVTRQVIQAIRTWVTEAAAGELS